MNHTARPLLDLLLRLSLSSALAAGLVAALDAAIAAGGARESLGAAGTFHLVASLAALTAVLGGLLGVAQWALCAGASSVPWSGWLRALREKAPLDRAVAAWVISLGIAGAALVTAMAIFSPTLFNLPEDVPARSNLLAL